jgi:putative transposase
MKRNRFSEDQVVRSLEEFESGRSVEEICREYNVARSTIYMCARNMGG